MKRMQCMMAAAMAVALSASVGATEYTWTPTAGGTTYDWNVAGNWGGAGFPSAAGDVANLNNDITGNQTIRLRQDIAVGHLRLGDSADGSHATVISNASGENFTLTFGSGEEGGPATLALSTPGTQLHNILTPTALDSDLAVDLGGIDTSNRQRIQLSNQMTMGASDLIFSNGVYGQNQIAFSGNSEFSGTGSILNNSSSTATVDGKKAFAGRVVANGRASGSNQSTFTFTGGGFTNASEMVVNGYIIDNVTRMGGGVHSGSGSTYSENPGQRFTRHRIALNGGYLIQHSQPATVGTANDWQMGLEWVVDEVAVFEFKSGYNYVSMTKASNTQGTRLDIGELRRGGGATAYLVGPSDPLREFLADNGAAFNIGADGAAGTTTRSIVPWTTLFISGGTGAIAGHGTYEAGVGLRALEASEYASSITAGPGHNVKTGAITLTEDTTVNSLFYDSWGNNNIGADRTLTIASGGLIMIRDRAIGQTGNAAAGTLNFGAAEGIIWAPNNNAAIIGAVVAGNGGLTKSGTGLLQLTGANTVSGPMHVGSGTLQVGDGTYSSNVGSGDVDVHAGARLWISGDGAISDEATVTLYNLGPDMYFGRIELDAARNEVVRYLYLGDEGMVKGTYGSTSSAAEFQDDRYFAGTGVLTVTSTVGGENLATLITIR